MKSARLLLFAALISLPAVLLIGTGWSLIAANVPRAIRHEPSRIGREYREVAEDMIRHPEKPTQSVRREKGWRRTSAIDGVPWGYVDRGEKTLVWCQRERSECRAVLLDTIRPFPYALVFYCGGSLVALTLVGLTALAILALFRFAKERDDFLAAVAHDLTTPLVGLRMMIGRDDEEARRLNERMLIIVGNIRDYLRFGGRRRPTCKVLDAVAACREAYSLFAADYEDSEGGAAAFLGLSRLEVFADETMLMQVFWNLFGNDLKYAAPYGRVSVDFRREKGMARVAFADEGQGMTRRQMRRAFDRYYRAKTVLVSGKGGFGIGLCAARDLARLMGGDLTVRPNRPKGCVFTLTLPLPSSPVA